MSRRGIYVLENICGESIYSCHFHDYSYPAIGAYKNRATGFIIL